MKKKYAKTLASTLTGLMLISCQAQVLQNTSQVTQSLNATHDYSNGFDFQKYTPQKVASILKNQFKYSDEVALEQAQLLLGSLRNGKKPKAIQYNSQTNQFKTLDSAPSCKCWVGLTTLPQLY